MNPPKKSKKPIPKVAAGGAAGVATTSLIILAGALGLDLSPEVAGAIVTLASFAAAYEMPST